MQNFNGVLLPSQVWWWLVLVLPPAHEAPWHTNEMAATGTHHHQSLMIIAFNTFQGCQMF